LFATAAVALGLAAPLGCARERADTMPPGAERGGAGADGNISAPDSLSEGAPDPDTTPMTESTMVPDASTNPSPGGDAPMSPPG